MDELAPHPDAPFAPAAWEPSLRALCERVRVATRAAMGAALEAGCREELARPVGRGAGDLTYGLDLPAERELDTWLDAVAARAPVSLFTEDSGWRHRGPGADGPRALDGFDHGGPRVVVDPIDGTRNLMADLRPAWTAVALCAPGAGVPRLSDARLGLLAELPDSRAARYRVLTGSAAGGDARLELRELIDGALVRADGLCADADDRPDHGYFSFFGYEPRLRPALAGVAAGFFERLAEREACDTRCCYDDQYISNAGQLALLASGTYRLIADLRALFVRAGQPPVVTSKPYDCAGALVVARAAGCVLRDPRGGALDFPLDATTPVAFVGWANAATARRLGPHLDAALREAGLVD